MILLDDERWKDFEGGYRIKYDASIPLKRLEGGGGEFSSIWAELWENLYHQGDVGTASYAAIPHVARIVRDRKILDFDPVALTVAIELARGRGENPNLPDWLKGDYHRAIRNLADYIFENVDKEWDQYLLKSALSLLAITKGSRDLAELIFEVDEGSERHALEKYYSD